MFRVLRFTPTATLADVARSICRTPARRIALVFPVGERTRFAAAGRMDALATLCREHHKDATVVGGDELLRAAAVAGGLRAAVTLDDWRDTVPSLSLRLPRVRAAAPATLTVIASPESDMVENGEDDGDDPFEVDPPAYVRELLAQFQATDGEADASQRSEGAGEEPRLPIQWRRPFAVAARASSLAYDLDPGSHLRALSEDDEERLTTTIRRTSGLEAELFAQSWPRILIAASLEGSKGQR